MLCEVMATTGCYWYGLLDPDQPSKYDTGKWAEPILDGSFLRDQRFQ